MADENVGVTPPDGDTIAGQVRVLLGDTAPAPLETPVAGLGQYAWYSDEELEILAALNGNSAKRVAIWVLSGCHFDLDAAEEVDERGPAG